MPYASHRAARIHYTQVGSGPVLVLLHGLLMAEGWRAGGVADELARDFTVISVDSLGDGASDKPADPALYVQAERVRHVSAVLDEVGCQQAHVLGYSMGGWLAVGLAKHVPSRVLSLAIGGWDIVGGLAPGPSGRVTFDQFLAYARRSAPALTSWVTPADESGLRACFDAMDELEGGGDAIVSFKGPVLLWSGDQDPYNPAMKRLAASHGIPFFTAKGDHLSAVYAADADLLRALRDFWKGATPVR